MNNVKQDNSKLFESWDLTSKNYLLFGIGIVCIIAGYIFMATGETTSVQSVKIAPIVLVIGYCIIIPVSIFFKFQK